MSSSVKKHNTRWIHCNVCFDIFGRNKFFLMACEHIICNTCAKKYDYKNCPICKKKTAYQEICNTMEKSILSYFSGDIIDQLDMVIKKIEFQRKHKFSLHYKLLNLEDELQSVKEIEEKIKRKAEYIDKKWNQYDKFEKELLHNINIIKKKEKDFLMKLEIYSQPSRNISSESGSYYARNASREAIRKRETSFSSNSTKRLQYNQISSPIDISMQMFNENSFLKNNEKYNHEKKSNRFDISIDETNSFINKLKVKDDSPYAVSFNDVITPSSFSSYYSVKKKATPNTSSSDILRKRNYDIH